MNIEQAIALNVSTCSTQSNGDYQLQYRITDRRRCSTCVPPGLVTDLIHHIFYRDFPTVSALYAELAA